MTASDDTWVTWRRRVQLASGDHTARVRAIDRNGRTQTAAQAEPAPDGATGLHQVSFTVQAP
jgi:sulfite oxidase